MLQWTLFHRHRCTLVYFFRTNCRTLGYFLFKGFQCILPKGLAEWESQLSRPPVELGLSFTSTCTHLKQREAGSSDQLQGNIRLGVSSHMSLPLHSSWVLRSNVSRLGAQDGHLLLMPAWHLASLVLVGSLVSLWQTTLFPFYTVPLKLSIKVSTQLHWVSSR